MKRVGQTDESAESLEHELELRLTRARGRLSRNDEQVLAFLRAHLDELAFHTSESIAQGAGVSRAAVVRFARRLGYAGFAELRDRGREALRGERPSPAGEDERSLLRRKVAADARALELLPTLLGGHLREAGERAARARTLWLLAGRETHGLVVYLHRLLHQVRDGVRLVDPGFPDALRDAEPQDVLLACTFRPYSRQTMELTALARDAGVAVVVVTDGYGHAFLAATDLVLAVPVESPALFLSFTSVLSTLEALAAYVARVDPDRTYETLAATGRFVERQRLMLEPGRGAAE